jgi:hypothetical protein
MGSAERKSLIKTIRQNYTLAFYLHKRTRLIGYKYPMNLQAPGSQYLFSTAYVFLKHLYLKYYCLISLKIYLLKHLRVFKSIKK